jgi:hypothetical protein
MKGWQELNPVHRPLCKLQLFNPLAAAAYGEEARTLTGLGPRTFDRPSWRICKHGRNWFS